MKNSIMFLSIICFLAALVAGNLYYKNKTSAFIFSENKTNLEDIVLNKNEQYQSFITNWNEKSQSVYKERLKIKNLLLFY